MFVFLQVQALYKHKDLEVKITHQPISQFLLPTIVLGLKNMTLIKFSSIMCMLLWTLTL